MFARLFGQTNKDTKSIRSTKTHKLNQTTYTELLQHLDTSITADFDDLIIISSPHAIHQCWETIHDSLALHNLQYIIPWITSLLFCNKSMVSSKLEFVTSINWDDVTRLMSIMSIIIIDIESSQYVAIPTNVLDLNCTNNIINGNKSYKTEDVKWQIIWNTNRAAAGLNFIHVMNNIYSTFHRIGSDFFLFRSTKRYNRQRPTLNDSIAAIRNAVQTLEKREIFLEKKIAIELKKAKQKAKEENTKEALIHLRKKKMLQHQLINMQGKKLGLETQVMALEDCHLGATTPHLTQSTRRTHRELHHDDENDIMEDINAAMDQVTEIHAYDLVSNDDELIEELQHEEMLHTVENQKEQTTEREMTDEDRQLAELEAMMM